MFLKKNQAQPQFASLHGEIVPPEPLRMTDSTYYTFLFGGKEANIQKLVDQFFNIPMGQPGRYVVHKPSVIISFARHRRCQVLQRDQTVLGNFHFDEMLVACLINSTSGADKGKLYSFVPFSFVNNPTVLAWGRTVYGMRMSSAEIKMANEKDPVFSCEAKALKTFSPKSRTQATTLLNLQYPSEKPREDKPPMFPLLQTGNNETLAKVDPARKEQHDFLFNDFITLKQFRDPHAGKKALYQGVLAYKYKGIEIEETPVKEEYSCSFPGYTAQFPIDECMGIDPEAVANIAFAFKAKFQFAPSSIIWEAPGNVYGKNERPGPFHEIRIQLNRFLDY